MMPFFGRNNAYDGFGCRDLWNRMPGNGIFMIIGGLLVLAVIVTIIVLLVRLAKRPAHYGLPMAGSNQYPVQPSAPAGESPEVKQALIILNERYARGEIDDDEYQRRKQNLLTGR